jgi:nicotinamide phosphoribosyltransferase
MLPPDLEEAMGYLEARVGAEHPAVLFNGLQPIIMKYLMDPVTHNDIDLAEHLANCHFGGSGNFNRLMWEHISNTYGGLAPLEIKAVPEGTIVPIDNVQMTVRNTGGKITSPLANAVESLLLKVWYPTTVATISYYLRQLFLEYHEKSGGSGMVDFMLHDFGYRGASSEETAEIGGLAHLMSFLGTDTIPAIIHGHNYYGAPIDSVGYSVPATEHFVMTSDGRDGEKALLKRLLQKYNTGIFSCVIDSYNSTRFIREYVREFKDLILSRGPNALGACKFVVRPDSLRTPDDTPEEQMVDITNELNNIFGSETNNNGYNVLNPKVGALWGDGINPEGIHKILEEVHRDKWTPDHLVFGMGGGLLQKVNRDTEKYAFKCCAQKRSGQWVDIKKDPLDQTKKSKGGRLKLIREVALDGSSKLNTINERHPLYYDYANVLETVYLNGKLMKRHTLEEVRQNARKG